MKRKIERSMKYFTWRQTMKSEFRIITAVLLISMSFTVHANSGSSNVSSGCATLEFMAKMVALNIMLPRNQDNMGALYNMNSQLLEMNKLVCQRVILTQDTRANSYYKNGSLVSNDLYFDPWYFPNGTLFMAEPGTDSAVYYPNGRPMAYHWMHSDQALFWPNGNIATDYFRAFDVPWYYPDGNVITYEAGYQGARWFYPIPRLDGGAGQEIISSDWGVEDERFTYLNFQDNGGFYRTRERIRRKLIFDDIELLDVPGVLLLITRLYQVRDTAKQFAPPDISITGAPF
jgi:hypothetical protein